MNHIEIKKEKTKEEIISLEDEENDNFTEVEHSCPQCGSENVFGMSRVVGYFSIIENWNASKKAELKRRQKGNYWYKEVK
ncbi:MAG TPA: anaerobic ribonucleoside-triphosphate reductase [Candidatus Bathyarchaeia archaeon]|nr:anaerobic ribonucleoside-triphosphate reductase [Candidatus Bathyarchaeia archaeon]